MKVISVISQLHSRINFHSRSTHSLLSVLNFFSSVSFLLSQLYCQKEKLVLKITKVLLRSKSTPFYQSKDWNKTNKLKKTYKRGTVKLFTFSFEIDAPDIISCAPKISAVRPKFGQCA